MINFSILEKLQPPYVKNPNEASDTSLALCWLGDTRMLGILYRSGFRPCPPLHPIRLTCYYWIT